MKVKVSITADDIRQGKRADPCLCPAARAIRRALDNKEVRVIGSACHGGFARVHFDPAQPAVELPPEAGRFVTAYDFGDPVGPLDFELTIPVFREE